MIINCCPEQLKKLKLIQDEINIADEDVYKIEEKVGMGSGAWDMVDPKEIIKASVEYYINKVLKDGRKEGERNH